MSESNRTTADRGESSPDPFALPGASEAPGRVRESVPLHEMQRDAEAGLSLSLLPVEAAVYSKSLARLDAIEWPEWVPLGPPEPPAFPTSLLPSWLAEFVTAVSVSKQVAPDLVGALVLSAASAALAGKCDVMAKPGWVEPVNLWVMAVELSGSGKSGAFSAVTKPIYACEKEMQAAAKPDVREYELERWLLETRLKKAKEAAAKHTGDSGAEAVNDVTEIGRQLDELTPVLSPRLIVSDATPEALSDMLCKQALTSATGTAALMVASPEGAEVLSLVTGRYGSKANMDGALKGWGGEPLVIDRKTAEPIRCDRPLLTMALGVQPTVVEGLGSLEGDLEGRGFLARFLLIWPPTIIGRRRWETAPVDDGAIARYGEKMAALIDRPRPQTEPPVVRLSDESARVFGAFFKETEARLAPGADLHSLHAGASKLRSHVLRIAAVLHFCKGLSDDEAIDDATTGAAVKLGWYFLAHLEYATHKAGADPELAKASKVWQACVRLSLDGRAVSRRSLNRALKGAKGLKRAADLDAPLALLFEHSYLKEVQPPGSSNRGRPLSKQILCNPAAVSAAR